jgi:WD40 repeat protein
LRLWDFERGKPVLSLKRNGTKWWGSPAAFSPDDGQFVVGQWDRNDMLLYLWDVRSGKQVRQMGGVWTDPTPAAAFTANGKHLLVAGSGRLERIAVADGKPERSIPISKDVGFATFTPDRAIALTVHGWMNVVHNSRMTFTLWDTVRGEELRELKWPK